MRIRRVWVFAVAALLLAGCGNVAQPIVSHPAPALTAAPLLLDCRTPIQGMGFPMDACVELTPTATRQ